MPQYARPETLPDALALLAPGGWQVLAGGTDIYPALSGQGMSRPVLDISVLPGLRGVAPLADGLRIGACSTWAEIARAPLPPALHALQQAALEVGGRQIQNAGTIGGNLCNASPAADGVPPLLVLEAQVELASSRGVRRMALADFITGPRQTRLAVDEMLVAVLIPSEALAGRSRFLKLGARAYLVISIAMVAARLVVTRGHVTAAALAVGSCSAVARRVPQIEALLIGAPVAQVAARITDAAVAAALAPMDDLRATAAYRETAAAELLRRAVADLAISDPTEGAA